MTTRLNSDRESESIFSPLRVMSERESQTNNFEGDFDYKRKSNAIPTSYNEGYFNSTTKKERLRDMNQMKAEIEQAKREEIVKIREINKLMKSMGKEEHENNIRLFQKYNDDEKQIIKSLIQKSKEKEINEKIAKRLHIIRASRKKEVNRSEMNFALNFTRQKNLIQKYEQAGEKSKQIRNDKIAQLSKVNTLKKYKSQKPKVQLSTQLFDTSFDNTQSEKQYSKELPSLNAVATMDTYRTDAMSNSIIQHLNNKELGARNSKVGKSYNSYRVPSQDNIQFSINQSMEVDQDARSSNHSLQPPLFKNTSGNIRSLSGIKFANGRSVDHSIFNPKGMFALPSIRNHDAIQLLHNYHTPHKTSLL